MRMLFSLWIFGVPNLFKEIEKAFAGEDFDKPTVAIAVAVAVFAIIIFGLLGS